jgi:hypothetical protein
LWILIIENFKCKPEKFCEERVSVNERITRGMQQGLPRPLTRGTRANPNHFSLSDRRFPAGCGRDFNLPAPASGVQGLIMMDGILPGG